MLRAEIFHEGSFTDFHGINNIPDAMGTNALTSLIEMFDSLGYELMDAVVTLQDDEGGVAILVIDNEWKMRV